GGNEVTAVLLRAVLPCSDFSRALTRRGTRAGVGDSNRLAPAHLGCRPRNVETRPRSLPGCRRLSGTGILPVGLAGVSPAAHNRRCRKVPKLCSCIKRRL